MTLSGSYPYVLPPPAIGTVMESFTATIVLEEEGPWVGHGSLTYGSHHVDNVPLHVED